MSLALILQVVLTFLKFPKELGDFVRLISKSPEEKRQQISEQVSAWMKESAESDRPTWGK